MRLIGGLLIVTAFFAVGSVSAREVRAELRALEAMLAFLRELSRRLTWERMPLQALFAQTQEPFLERIGFLPLLRNADPKQYALAWKRALARLPLSGEPLRALETLGQGLGLVPLETQKEQLMLGIAVLEEAYASQKAKAGDKQRSAVSLWTLSGLLIALLFI